MENSSKKFEAGLYFELPLEKEKTKVSQICHTVALISTFMASDGSYSDCMLGI